MTDRSLPHTDHRIPMPPCNPPTAARAQLRPIGPAIAVRNLNPDEYHLAIYNGTLYSVTWDYRGRPECQTNTQTLDDSDIVQPVGASL